MRVKLPKVCTGSEVISAFKKALSRSSGWNFKEEADEKRYEPGSVRRVVISSMLNFNPIYSTSSWFFGPGIKNESVNFGIGPLELKSQFEEIDVNVFQSFGEPCPFEEIDDILSDKNDIERIRNKFENLLGSVYESLGHQDLAASN